MLSLCFHFPVLIRPASVQSLRLSLALVTAATSCLALLYTPATSDPPLACSLRGLSEDLVRHLPVLL